jgi:polysaccharide export outer membrane protein
MRRRVIRTRSIAGWWTCSDRSGRRLLPCPTVAGHLLDSGGSESLTEDCRNVRICALLVAFPQVSLTVAMIRSLTQAICALCATFAVVALSLPATEAATPAPAAAVAAVGPDYLIGPGDKLQIYVWQNPDLTVTVPVRQDGKVSTPLVEDMLAAGKTPSVLARDIETVLAEYVRSPKVNVFVLEAVSAFSQVKVTGQVKTPQAMPFHEGMTVLDAVLAAGGLTDFAAGNRARVVRTVEGKQQEIKVRLDKLLNSGDMSQNVALRPGDVILIPQSRF